MTTRNEFFTIMQAGIETAYGDAAAATKILIGQAPRVVSDSKPELPVEQFNVRMNARRAIVYERLYTSTYSIANAGFQQLILPFQTGLKGVTPAETTPSQSDYLWTFTPNLTAAAGLNAPKSFCARLGDSEQAWIVPGCHTDRVSIKGSIGQDGGAAPVSVEMSYFGQKIDEGTFTGALSNQSSTPMNAKLARLYWDPSWANVGVTEVTDGLVDFTAEIMMGIHPVFRGGANIYPASANEGVIDYTLALTIDSVLRDEIMSAQQAGSLAVMRLEIEGPQIGTGSNHKLTLDMGGFFNDVVAVDKADRGDNQSTVALAAAYDDTGAKGLQVLLTTNQQTI